MNQAEIRCLPPRDSGCSLRLVLVRHGEPSEEVHGRCHGILDVGLSEAGRQQLCSRIDLLRSLTADVMYTSTSKRAFESANEINRHLTLPVQAVAELCEINFGEFEGLTYSEIESRYPQEFQQWMERPTEIKFPRGESFPEMNDRVLGFLAFLVRVHRGQTVLIVSHAGVNRIILADALGLSSDKLFRIDQAYAAVNVIDYFPQSAVVRLMNG